MLQHVSDVHIAHEVFKRMDGQRQRHAHHVSIQEDEDDDLPQTGGYIPNVPTIRGGGPLQGAYVAPSQSSNDTGVNHAFMVDDIPSISYVNKAYVVKLRTGLVMADTGCKKAVGGSDWHRITK